MRQTKNFKITWTACLHCTNDNGSIRHHRNVRVNIKVMTTVCNRDTSDHTTKVIIITVLFGKF
jgi:hypothetical protein